MSQASSCTFHSIPWNINSVDNPTETPCADATILTYPEVTSTIRSIPRTKKHSFKTVYTMPSAYTTTAHFPNDFRALTLEPNYLWNLSKGGEFGISPGPTYTTYSTLSLSFPICSVPKSHSQQVAEINFYVVALMVFSTGLAHHGLQEMFADCLTEKMF